MRMRAEARIRRVEEERPAAWEGRGPVQRGLLAAGQGRGGVGHTCVLQRSFPSALRCRNVVFVLRPCDLGLEMTYGEEQTLCGTGYQR